MTAALAKAEVSDSVPGSECTNGAGWDFHPAPGLLLTVPVGFVSQASFLPEPAAQFDSLNLPHGSLSRWGVRGRGWSFCPGKGRSSVAQGCHVHLIQSQGPRGISQKVPVLL